MLNYFYYISILLPLQSGALGITIERTYFRRRSPLPEDIPIKQFGSDILLVKYQNQRSTIMKKSKGNWRITESFFATFPVS